MIRIVGNDKVRAHEFAHSRWNILGGAWKPETFSALYLEKNGDIQAAVLYREYIPANSIEVHLAAVAGGRWLTRSFLRAAFSYPFEQLDVRRLTALIAADNLPSIKWTEHCGFTLEGRAREAWAPNVDVLIYGMLKRECRFLGNMNGKTEHPDASRSSRNSSGADGIKSGDGENECRAESRQYEHAVRESHL